MKALRAFMVAVARAMNAGDASMKSLSALATPAGIGLIAKAVASDLQRHATMPGPYPFTPVSVRVHGDQADVMTCVKATGWSLDPTTRQPWEKSTVKPFLFTMKRVDGQWRFASTDGGKVDCSGVKIAEVKW